MSIELEASEPTLCIECDNDGCSNSTYTGHSDESFTVLCKDCFNELREAKEQLKRFQNKFGIMYIPAHDETQEEALFK